MRPHGSPKELEQRRFRALALLAEGWHPVDVARELGVDRRSVRRWRASNDKEGRKGVLAKPAPGRPPKLDERQREELKRLLLSGALECGFSTDLWTCRRVRSLIQRDLGVEYHVDHVGRLLRSLGWSPQKPARRARERDEERISGWIKKEWPRVKKTLPGAERGSST